MEKLVFVKLGGCLITNKKKNKTLNLEVIDLLCKQLANFYRSSGTKIILANGGGSYSHPPSEKYKVYKGYINKKSLFGIAEVEDLGSQLNRIVVRKLIDYKVPAITLNPSSSFITTNSEITEAYLEPLISSVRLGMVPVVYGDVLFDKTTGCSDISTEKMFNYLAIELKSQFKIDKIIYCGITDGVYDSKGQTIPVLTKRNLKSYMYDIKHSDGVDVTGGMIHKVEEALRLADFGIESVIINGVKPRTLLDTLNDNCAFGTRIEKNKNNNSKKMLIYKSFDYSVQ